MHGQILPRDAGDSWLASRICPKFENQVECKCSLHGFERLVKVSEVAKDLACFRKTLDECPRRSLELLEGGPHRDCMLRGARDLVSSYKWGS